MGLVLRMHSSTPAGGLLLQQLRLGLIQQPLSTHGPIRSDQALLLHSLVAAAPQQVRLLTPQQPRLALVQQQCRLLHLSACAAAASQEPSSSKSQHPSPSPGSKADSTQASRVAAAGAFAFPAAPLLVFGSDGGLQLSTPASTSAPASAAKSAPTSAPPPAKCSNPPSLSSSPASKAAGSKRSIRAGDSSVQGNKGTVARSISAEAGPSTAASRAVARWKEDVDAAKARPGAARPDNKSTAAAAPPKYSKAARRFYNEKFRKAERLSKVLASAGLASRRACEEIIFAGRVTVNGAVCTVPQTPVDLIRDNIYIDGRSLPKKLPPKLYFIVNKPKGYICTSPEAAAATAAGAAASGKAFGGTNQGSGAVARREGRGSGDGAGGGKSAVSLVDAYMEVWRKKNPGVAAPRLFTVGRLDVATTGLLVITNDGDFAHRVSHPSSGFTKEYIITIAGKATRRQLTSLGQGTVVDGVLCEPLLVEVVDEGSTGGGGGSGEGSTKQRLRVVVGEGRNREVRTMVENVGLTVAALKRVRIGSLKLPKDLGLGQFRVLDASEAVKIAEKPL